MTPHAPDIVFGLSPVWVASVLLVLTYVLIITERLNRSIIALLGGGVMIISGVLTQDEAIAGIDFNTIALLTGMMVLVSISRRCGMFEYLAIWSAKKGRAQPWVLLIILSLTTAVLSALLDNVTTVLLIAPVTLAVTRELKVPPYPFLFAEIFASNIGGTATLIGDPPNIIIGSAAGLSFDDFVLNLTPIILLVMAAQLVATHLIWGRAMHATDAARARVMALDERATITDWPLLRYSLTVIAIVMGCFVFARPLHLEPGTIALFGAAVLMLLHNIEHHAEKEKQSVKVTETFNEVDWITIFFFVGLFVVVHGFETTGAIAAMGRELLTFAHGNLAITASTILWAAAIISAVIDNIPFVAAMIPLIKVLAPAVGGEEALLPLWWALSLGACLGGNGTLIGASANLTVAGIAQRNGVRFDFLTYGKYAAPLTVINVAICQIYLWLRYF
jgi:Na+/H+ antiporter NhaD/arsenite permease-like protein